MRNHFILQYQLFVFERRKKKKEKPCQRNCFSIHKTSTIFLRKKFSYFWSLWPRFWPDLLNNCSPLLYRGSCLVKVQFKLLLCINTVYSVWDHCHGRAVVLPGTGSRQQALTDVEEAQSRSLTHIACILCRCSPFILGFLGLPWCRMRKLLKSLRDFTSSWTCCPQISSNVHGMRWSVSVMGYSRSVLMWETKCWFMLSKLMPVWDFSLNLHSLQSNKRGDVGHVETWYNIRWVICSDNFYEQEKKTLIKCVSHFLTLLRGSFTSWKNHLLSALMVHLQYLREEWL